MKRRSDSPTEQELLRDKLIGLGEQSIRKSYYPELQSRLGELETYRTLLDEINDAIFLVQLPDGNLIDFNSTACSWLGIGSDMLKGRFIGQFADVSASRFAGREYASAAELALHEHEVLTTSIKCHDGREIPVEITINLRTVKNVLYAVIVARDISERQRNEEELRRLNAELERRVRERTQQIEETNASLLEEIEERTRIELELKGSNRALEYVNKCLQEANENLERMASTDRLTGSWNRRYFEKQVETEMERTRRYNTACSLMMLDIDHFKRINDEYGHLAGDLVLFELAHLLQDNLRRVDSLTRWGGEEFVVLAPHTDVADAYGMAEKLRRLVEQHVFTEAGRITISIGVAELKEGMTLDNWLKDADDALYDAKALGRNRVKKAKCACKSA